MIFKVALPITAPMQNTIAVFILIGMTLIYKQVIHAQFLKGNRVVFLSFITEPVKTVL